MSRFFQIINSVSSGVQPQVFLPPALLSWTELTVLRRRPGGLGGSTQKCLSHDELFQASSVNSDHWHSLWGSCWSQTGNQMFLTAAPDRLCSKQSLSSRKESRSVTDAGSRAESGGAETSQRSWRRFRCLRAKFSASTERRLTLWTAASGGLRGHAAAFQN